MAGSNFVKYSVPTGFWIIAVIIALADAYIKAGKEVLVVSPIFRNNRVIGETARRLDIGMLTLRHYRHTHEEGLKEYDIIIYFDDWHRDCMTPEEMRHVMSRGQKLLTVMPPHVDQRNLSNIENAVEISPDIPFYVSDTVTVDKIVKVMLKDDPK